MKEFRLDLWKPEEYTYEAAYGFMPNVHAYLHDEDSEVRKCMLVVPGGGYCMLAPHEGELVAMNYYRMGLNAFVLTYTNDITMSVPLKKQPMNDLSRAIRLIRSKAAEYCIDPAKLLICGFSAGGHVCGSLCTHFEEIIDPDAGLNAFSNRPDGAIFGYPVITSGEYTHIYSMWALLGQNASQEELDYFSVEKQVKENMPPCFLWQTVEDNLVPVENTYLLAKALKEKKVPYAQYVYPFGGHGLSVASMEQFQGWHGGEYVQEQTWLAVEAVKKDQGVNVSAQRKAELIDQFTPKEPDPNAPAPQPPADFVKKLQAGINPFADVNTWVELSRVWFERFL
ncbi:MAG: alpha/beta hydrolase [Acetatifactor sp.]|nr:alpha/beta hydrolase [Acetatifactor sp.]